MGNIYNYIGQFHDSAVDGMEWINFLNRDFSGYYYKSWVLDGGDYSIIDTSANDIYKISAPDASANACVFHGINHPGFISLGRFEVWGYTHIYMPDSTWTDSQGGSFITDAYENSIIETTVPLLFNNETFTFHNNSSLVINSPFTSNDPDTVITFRDNSSSFITPNGSLSGLGSINLYETAKITFHNMEGASFGGLTANFNGTENAIGFYSGFNAITAQAFIDSELDNTYEYVLTSSHSGWIAPATMVDAIKADESWFPIEPGLNDPPSPPLPDEDIDSDPDDLGYTYRIKSDTSYRVIETYPHPVVGGMPNGTDSTENLLYTTLKLNEDHNYSVILMPSGFYVAYNLGGAPYLYTSDVNNKLSWPATNRKVLDSNVIYAIESDGDLVVFTEKSVYLFSGSSPYPLVGIQLRIRRPLVSVNSVIKSKLGLLYLSDEGLMSVNGRDVQSVLGAAIIGRQFSDLFSDLSTVETSLYDDYCILKSGTDSIMFHLDDPVNSISSVVFSDIEDSGLPEFKARPVYVEKPTAVRYIKVDSTQLNENATIKIENDDGKVLELTVKTGHIAPFPFGTVTGSSYLYMTVSEFSTVITGVSFGSGMEELR